MTNIDKVASALGEWGFNIAKAFLPQYKIPVGGKLGGLMQLIGQNPATYNIWNELGFLAEPLIQTVTTPLVQRMLNGIPDEQVPEIVMKFIDSFIERAEEKGSVNLFGIELGKSSFERLKDIMENKISM
ncbi:MAG: hypothetical protein IKW20_00120 [Bacteroidales bacterium]|nr:hypothetical protein [Bacteroidales bacterium]